jgi:uncharacterized membrane protein
MRKWFGLAAILLAAGFGAIVYPRLPDRVPSHWNFRGEVDGWTGPLAAVLLMPAIGVAMWILLRVFPRVDPRRENYAKFQGTYDILVNTIVTFLALVHVVVLASAIGWPVSIERLMPAGMGLLFIVIGNFLPRARPNWFLGIRTPWTLTNDRVWERTHRVGGYLFVIAGVVFTVMALSPLPLPGAAIAATVCGVAVISIAYSFVAWRQETAR